MALQLQPLPAPSSGLPPSVGGQWRYLQDVVWRPLEPENPVSPSRLVLREEPWACQARATLTPVETERLR